MSDNIELLQARVAELERLVHVPGLWRCAKCGFALLQSNLNALDGTVTARDEPGTRCPNDGAPLWRVTERENGRELMERLDAMLLPAAGAVPTPPIDGLDGIVIDAIGGHAPVQAEGHIDGEPFYFRARGDHWALSIGSERTGDIHGRDVIGSPSWHYDEAWPGVSWMSADEARCFIAKGAALWRARNEGTTA